MEDSRRDLEERKAALSASSAEMARLKVEEGRLGDQRKLVLRVVSSFAHLLIMSARSHGSQIALARGLQARVHCWPRAGRAQQH